MAKEWYLIEFENKHFLHNISLRYRAFPSKNGEHDHCELCWARFSNYPNDHHYGYYDKHSSSWICADCYCDHKELFGWTLEDET